MGEPISLEMLDLWGGLDTLPWSLDDINFLFEKGEAELSAVGAGRVTGSLYYSCEAGFEGEADCSMLGGMRLHDEAGMDAVSAAQSELERKETKFEWVETETLLRAASWT